MVGAGVLTTSGYTVALVGSNQWMLFLWVLGGITAVCGALTLAELSAALPEPAATTSTSTRRTGRCRRSCRAGCRFLIGFSGPSAAAAFAFAKYTLAPFPVAGANSSVLERMLGDRRDPDLRGHSRLGSAADGQGAGLDHHAEIDRLSGHSHCPVCPSAGRIRPTSPT